MNDKISSKKTVLATVLMSLLLSGCGSEDSGTSGNGSQAGDNSPENVTRLKINATSYNNWTYVNLDDAAVVTLSEEQAADSNAWHLAFRRHAVKSNGGASGSGLVQVALADEQAEFYNEAEPVANVFLNADASQYLADLEKTYAQDQLAFSQDSQQPVIAGADWYIYNPTTHTLSANTANAWLVRHADGDTYSKVWLTDLAAQADRSYQLVLGFETQAADTTQFAGGERSVTAAMAQGSSEICVDLDSAAAVDCNAALADWDLRFEISRESTALWTNGGVYGGGSGATMGTQTKTDLMAYTSATSVDGQSILSHYQADRSTSVFDEHSWYGYGLAGANDHQLYPNFRTFVIDTNKDDADSAQYSLQLINYYSLGGSGTPEIRFIKHSISQGQ